MLSTLRKGVKSKVVKFFLFGLMVAAVAGLVMTDVGGFFRSGPPQDTVATIGRTKLRLPEFDNIVRNTVTQQGMDTKTAYEAGLIDRILQNEVNANVLLRNAAEYGLAVNDQHVAQQISQIVAPYAAQGMTARDALLRFLRTQNLSEAQFVQMVRGEMTHNLLLSALRLSAGVPSLAEARDLYRADHEKRDIAFVVLPHADIKDVDESNDDVLRVFYESGKARYAEPEMRAFTLAILTPESVQKELDVSDEELRALYESEKANLTTPERRTVEQAILSSEDEANDVVEKIKGGADLQKAVKDVAGSASGYTGSQTYQKDGLSAELAGAVFDTDKGAVASPVKTGLGWHVMVVKDILSPQTPSFESVRADLRADIMENRMGTQVYETANMIDDQLAGGMSLEDIAKDLSLEVKTFGLVTQDGMDANGKDKLGTLDSDKALVLDNVFATAEGEASPVFEISGGRFATVRVDQLEEASFRAYEDVRGELAKLWLADQREVLNKNRADKLAAALGADTDFDALAREYGARVQKLTLSRQAEAPAPLHMQTVGAFFNADKGSTVIQKQENAFIVGRVQEVHLPSNADIAKADLSQDVAMTQRLMEGEVGALYMDHLRRTYKVRVNDRLLQTTYGADPDQRY